MYKCSLSSLVNVETKHNSNFLSFELYAIKMINTLADFIVLGTHLYVPSIKYWETPSSFNNFRDSLIPKILIIFFSLFVSPILYSNLIFNNFS